MLFPKNRFAHFYMTGLRRVKIVFNVHNPEKLKILTVNPYTRKP